MEEVIEIVDEEVRRALHVAFYIPDMGTDSKVIFLHDKKTVLATSFAISENGKGSESNLDTFFKKFEDEKKQISLSTFGCR